MAKGNFWTEVVPKDKRKINKEGFKKAIELFKYAWPYRKHYWIGMVFLVLSTITTLTFPILIGEMTKVMEGKSTYTINQVAAFFALILILQGIFSFFRVYFFSYVSEKTAGDLRTILYDKYISSPITFFETNRVGDLQSRINSDVSSIQGILSTTVAELFRQVATLIIGTSILFYISWKLTFFMLATFPIMVIATLVFGRYIRVFGKKVQDKLAEASVLVEETLQSISTVKAFTNEPLESKKYKVLIADTVKLALKGSTLRGGLISFFIIGLFGGVVLVIWFGGNLVVGKEILISDLIQFLTLTFFIGGSLSGLGDLYAQIQRTIGASERILEIIAEPVELDLKEEFGLNEIKGTINFKDLNFNYPSRPDLQVLKNINIDIPAGKKVAIVGHSGAGKSTLVQLLMKFYSPNTGQVLIDGLDIKDQNVGFLRQNIAIVPQEVMLFGGTIFENIAYGKPGASMEEVKVAAQKAFVDEFVERFPDKYETIVGERGIKLSGGQRQRIAIARAILKNPSILLLDEATSALDSESEQLVQAALTELLSNRTSIIIAHRLATVKNADYIYVLKNGEIIEQGKPSELLSDEEGSFAKMVKLQFEMANQEIE